MLDVRWVVALVMPSCLLACGVPEVSLSSDAGAASGDATADAADARAADASPDAPIDGGKVDADAAGTDAGAEGGVCPGANPFEAGVCCADAGAGLWCGGQCTANDCGRCPACDAGEACCVKKNGHPGVCQSPSAACP